MLKEKFACQLPSGDRAFGLQTLASPLPINKDESSLGVLVASFWPTHCFGADSGGVRLLQPNLQLRDIVMGVEVRNVFYSPAQQLLFCATPSMILVFRRRDPSLTADWVTSVLSRAEKRHAAEQAMQRERREMNDRRNAEREAQQAAIAQWKLASPEAVRALYARTRTASASLKSIEGDMEACTRQVLSVCEEFRRIREDHCGFVPVLVALANLETSAGERSRMRDWAQKSSDTLSQGYFEEAGLLAEGEPPRDVAPFDITLFGFCFLQGYGKIRRNLTKAASLFRLAADLKDPAGCANLGYCLLEGTGVEANKGEAVAALRAASTYGHAVSACNYFTQAEEATDSLRFLTLAANAGNEVAMRLLGNKLRKEEMTREEGTDWLREAAALDDWAAKEALKDPADVKAAVFGGENKVETEQDLVCRTFGRAEWAPIAAARVRSEGGVWNVSASPDGRWMAVATSDIGVLVYDLQNLNPNALDDYISIVKELKPSAPTTSLPFSFSPPSFAAPSTLPSSSNSTADASSVFPASFVPSSSWAPSFGTSPAFSFGSSLTSTPPQAEAKTEEGKGTSTFLWPTPSLDVSSLFTPSSSPLTSSFAFPPSASSTASSTSATTPSLPASPICTPVEHSYFMGKSPDVGFFPSLPSLRPHIRLPIGEPYASFFSPDGRYLAAAGYSRSVCIWRVDHEEQNEKAHLKEGAMPCARGSVRWKLASFSTSSTIWTCHWLPTPPSLPLRLLALSGTGMHLYGMSKPEAEGELSSWVSLAHYSMPDDPSKLTVSLPPSHWWAEEKSSSKYLVATGNGSASLVELWVLEEKHEIASNASPAESQPNFYMGDSEEENIEERLMEAERDGEDGEDDVDLIKMHLASVKSARTAARTSATTNASSGNSADKHDGPSLSRLAVYTALNEQYTVEISCSSEGVELTLGGLDGNVKVLTLTQPPACQPLAEVARASKQAAKEKEERKQAEASGAERMCSAAERGDIGEMQRLLEGPSLLNGLNCAPLFSAICSQKMGAVKWLLAQNPALVNQTVPKPGWDRPLVNTPLLEACHSRNSAMVELLLEAKANPLQENTHDGGPLVFAAVEQDGSLLRLFARFKVDFNHSSALYCNGETPLHMAAFWDYANNISTLLDGGHNVNACDGQGRSVLEFTCTRKHIFSFRVLLKRGAIATPECLLDACTAFVNGKNEEDFALEMINALVPVVGVTARDDTGASPLHKAARSGWIKCVKALIQKGIPQACTDNYGKTPLDVMNKKSPPDMAALLARN